MLLRIDVRFALVAQRTASQQQQVVRVHTMAVSAVYDPSQTSAILQTAL